MEKGGEAAEHSHVSHKALHLLLKQIGEASAPGAGHALAALAMGPIGALIALATIANEIKKHIDEISEATEKLNEEQLAEHQANVASLKQLWDDAKISLGKYQSDMMHVGEDNDPIKTAIAREKELEAARIEGSKNAIEMAGREEEAYIRRNAAKNDLTHAEMEEKIRQSKEATADKLRALETAKPAGDLALLQAELDKRKQDREPLAAREAAAEGPAIAARQKLQAAQKELDNLRQQKSDDVTKAEANVERTKGYSFKIDPFGVPNYRRGEDYENKAAEEELQRALKELDNVTTRQSQLEAGLTAEARAKADADHAFEAARAANLENQRRIRELPADIQQAQAVAALRSNPNANVYSPLNDLNNRTPTVDPVATNRQANDTARRDVRLLQDYSQVEHAGGKLSKEQAATKQKLADAILGHHATAKETNDLLQLMITKQATIDEAFTRLKAQVLASLENHR
ncbi:MAG TPA: hypothetical protein VNN22_24150 [Verrucomicrobiae bacterium]|nr:hypothetical protein [Verrucomicrobiae bacterium]